MSIESFVKGMLPSFDSSRIHEDLEALREEIKENLLPPYAMAVTLTRGKTLQSQYARDLDARFRKQLPEFRNVGVFEGTRRIFTNVSKNLELLEIKTNELFNKDVTRETMTYQRANILQYLTNCRFAARYAIRALNRCAANEAAHQFNRPEHVDSALSPADLKWFAENTGSYLQALISLNTTPADFGRSIDSVPAILVSENTSAMAVAAHGRSKLDPMRMGFDASSKMNIIYHIRMSFAEWQVARIKEKQEERKMLELRLLRLKESYQGKDSPALAKSIEYNEARLQRLNAELEDIEQRYA